MKVCVCGQGKVGRPLLRMLRAKGVSVVGYDVDPLLTEAPSVKDAVAQSEMALFIVPTPSLPDGSFSNEYLEAALDSFHEEARRQRKTASYIYVIVSTTVPGSCDAFRKIVGDNICYKPEFIRLEYVDADLLTPSFILIGEGSKMAGGAVEDLYRMVSTAPVKRMTLVEAELAKITLNCALTMKISLANQLWLVARHFGADAAKIMEAVGCDPRIGPDYIKPGMPYGGPCLPRDNRMFRFVAERFGVDARLSEAADMINEATRKATWHP